MIQRFTKDNFLSICNTLSRADMSLALIIDKYGYPPMWTRPNTFESLIHIILEQQVSLASALAALNKLKVRLKEVSPAALLQLTDQDLKDCYFSRQKTVYARALANALQQKYISLESFEKIPDGEVRQQLVSIKGIGNWTVDIYLMFVLQRADIFPLGDLAAVNALKKLHAMPIDASRDDVAEIAAKWSPYRTVATMILWHNYLSSRKKP